MNGCRIYSLVVCGLLLLTLFFSMLFISEEMGHHDCTGEDCPVCAVIDICINNVGKMRYSDNCSGCSSCGNDYIFRC